MWTGGKGVGSAVVGSSRVGTGLGTRLILKLHAKFYIMQNFPIIQYIPESREVVVAPVSWFSFFGLY